MNNQHGRSSRAVEQLAKVNKDIDETEKNIRAVDYEKDRLNNLRDQLIVQRQNIASQVGREMSPSGGFSAGNSGSSQLARKDGEQPMTSNQFHGETSDETSIVSLQALGPRELEMISQFASGHRCVIPSRKTSVMNANGIAFTGFSKTMKSLMADYPECKAGINDIIKKVHDMNPTTVPVIIRQLRFDKRKSQIEALIVTVQKDSTGTYSYSIYSDTFSSNACQVNGESVPSGDIGAHLVAYAVHILMQRGIVDISRGYIQLRG